MPGDVSRDRRGRRDEVVGIRAVAARPRRGIAGVAIEDLRDVRPARLAIRLAAVAGDAVAVVTLLVPRAGRVDNTIATNVRKRAVGITAVAADVVAVVALLVPRTARVDDSIAAFRRCGQVQCLSLP